MTVTVTGPCPARIFVLAAAALLSVGDAEPCSCSGSTPCQHTGGVTCHSLVLGDNGLQCPKDTDHCSCSCTAAAPCQRDGRCEPTVSLQNKQVCETGAVHCQPSAHYAGGADADDKLQTLDCPCAGQRPCHVLASGNLANVASTCVAPIGTGDYAGKCADGTERCFCPCAGYEKCYQHDASGGKCNAPHVNGTCPSGTLACLSPAMVLKRSTAGCKCGLGTPCRKQDGSCTAMVNDGNGRWHCDALTGQTRCSCGCKADVPCMYTDENGGSFCFAAEDGHCSAGTTHCSAEEPPEQIVDVASATTPAPDHSEVVDVDTSVLDSDVSTAAPNTAETAGAGDCLFDGWTDWSPCTRACGGGRKERSPKITRLPAAGGAACPKTQIRVCNDQACDNVNCKLSESEPWQPWSNCSVDGRAEDARGVLLACGNGTQISQPNITAQPRDYGAPCPEPRRRACNENACYNVMPSCRCDPFADSGARDFGSGLSSTQTDENDPARKVYDLRGAHGFDSTVTQANGDSISCVLNGTVQITHPNNNHRPLLTGPGKTENAGIKHVCAADKQSGACKCCKCHAVQCHRSAWSEWSACVSEAAGPSTDLCIQWMPA
eukprot:g2431.t1